MKLDLRHCPLSVARGCGSRHCVAIAPRTACPRLHRPSRFSSTCSAAQRGSGSSVANPNVDLEALWERRKAVPYREHGREQLLDEDVTLSEALRPFVFLLTVNKTELGEDQGQFPHHVFYSRQTQKNAVTKMVCSYSRSGEYCRIGFFSQTMERRSFGRSNHHIVWLVFVMPQR